MGLSKEEADTLFKMRKIPAKSVSLSFPEEGDRLEIELCSEDKRYNFQADINRKGNKAKKLIYQNRSNKVYVLRRLDFIGAPHGNPSAEIDDELLNKYKNADIPCPHVHLYVEGFNDKWAVPLDEILEIKIEESDDSYTLMEKFFNYCNIEIPEFKPIGLFTWKI